VGDDDLDGAVGVELALAAAPERIVSDDSYRQNMRHLRRLRDPIDGAANAAREMLRFIEGWYNPHRRHSSRNCAFPIEYERKNAA
jgi:hypothetical protein